METNIIGRFAKSEKFKQWEKSVRIHHAYNKHIFRKSATGIKCNGCGLYEKVYMVDKKIDSIEAIDNMIYTAIYHIVKQRDYKISYNIFHALKRSNVSTRLLRDYLEFIFESREDTSSDVASLMDNIIDRITSENLVDRNVIRFYRAWPHHFLSLMNAIKGKIMFLSIPRNMLINDLPTAYLIASMTKGGMDALGEKTKRLFLPPLNVVVKDKQRVKELIRSGYSLYNAKLWLALQFPEIYEELKREKFTSIILDLLLFVYKHNKDYNLHLKEIPRSMVTPKMVEGILDPAKFDNVYELATSPKVIKQAIHDNYTLDQFYKEYDNLDGDYMKYYVDEYGIVQKAEDIVYPNINKEEFR